VRPLLALSREQIESYCEQHGLTPMQDASNFDTTFLRNWIRHEFMPAFSSHNPQFKDNLTQLATIVQADEAVLENATKSAFAAILVENNNANIKFDLVKWRQLAVGLQRRVLRMALTTLQPNFTEIGFRTIELARAVANGQVGGKASLPTGLVLRVGYDFIVIGQQSPKLPTLQLTNASPLPLALPGVTAIGNGWEIEASWEKMPASFPQNPLIVYLHLPESTPLFVRPRQAGERFQPLGMGGKSVTLKKAMINWKMPASSRALHPIVATPNHVVWVVGQQIDERVKVDTQEFLWRLTCKKTVTLSSE
jgi:tRNA(Ile)-lysidine synthase